MLLWGMCHPGWYKDLPPAGASSPGGRKKRVRKKAGSFVRWIWGAWLRSQLEEGCVE